MRWSLASLHVLWMHVNVTANFNIQHVRMLCCLAEFTILHQPRKVWNINKYKCPKTTYHFRWHDLTIISLPCDIINATVSSVWVSVDNLLTGINHVRHVHNTFKTRATFLNVLKLFYRSGFRSLGLLQCPSSLLHARCDQTRWSLKHLKEGVCSGWRGYIFSKNARPLELHAS